MLPLLFLGLAALCCADNRLVHNWAHRYVYGLLCREEFLSAFEEQVAVLRRQEEIQAELEACGSDMERMAPILDELDALSKQVRPATGRVTREPAQER